MNLKSSTIIHLWQTELWLFWHCVGSIYFLRRFISKPDIDISQDKSNETFYLFFTDSLFPGKARVLTFEGILNLKWALFFASNENHMRWMRGNYSSPPFIKLCWILQPFNLSDCTIPHLGSQDEQQEILAMNKNCYFVLQAVRRKCIMNNVRQIQICQSQIRTGSIKFWTTPFSIFALRNTLNHVDVIIFGPVTNNKNISIDDSLDPKKY